VSDRTPLCAHYAIFVIVLTYVSAPIHRLLFRPSVMSAPASASTPVVADDVSRVQPIFDRINKSFANGKTMSFEYRETQLKNLIRGFKEMESQINDALKADLGLRAFHCYFYSTDAISAELNYTLNNFRAWADRKVVPTPDGLQPGSSYLLPEPLGSVLILGPWNFPLTCAIPYLGSAIAAGNTACVKPSELSPNCSRVTVELIEKYLDPECYSVVEGAADVANKLIHLQWNHVIFTGSPEKGKIVAKACAENLVPYTLELGGKNPAYVDKDADLDNAALRICDVKMYNWSINLQQKHATLVLSRRCSHSCGSCYRSLASFKQTGVNHATARTTAWFIRTSAVPWSRR
jgi:aldehyde dehydrogenase (NAD+)